MKIKTLIEFDEVARKEGNIKLWKNGDYVCLILRHVDSCSKHLNGYVGLPEGHGLFGKGYNDKMPISKEQIESLGKQPIGKRNILDVVCGDSDNPSLSLYFNVHGGVTFAGEWDWWQIDKRWWLGFDTSHCDDLSRYYLEEDNKHIFLTENSEYRDLEYVTNEVNSLVEQIKAL